MHLAAMMGHVEKLERLIEMGEDAEIKDLDGLTPLHYACGEGHLDCVVALLDGGASVESRDAENDMPIHIACQEGQQEVVHELLERYPYLLQMSGSGHSTLLHMVAASHEDRTSLLEMLLGLGADVNVKDGEGKTALEIAEQVEDEEPDHPHLGILQGAMGITKAFVSAEEGSALRRATAEKAYTAIKNKDRRTLEKLLSGG
jgi:ankyrin repeat protein